MSKTYKASRVVRVLEAKGFQRVKHGGDKMLEFWVDDRKVLFTFVSHGNGECENYHVGKMAKQCKLARPQFRRLVECPMTEDEYVRRLREQGLV